MTRKRHRNSYSFMRKAVAIFVWPGFYLTAFLSGFFLIESRHWADLRPGLVAALSLLSATILVRLARPFPITDADAFRSLDELEKFRSHVTTLAKYQVMLLFIAVTATLLAIFLPETLGLIGRLSRYPLLAPYSETLQNAVSGFAAFVMAMALTRIIAIVRFDRQLLELHGDAVKRAWVKKRDKAIIEQVEKARADMLMIETGDSYEGRIDPPRPS